MNLVAASQVVASSPVEQQDLLGHITPWELGLLIAGLMLTLGLVILFAVVFLRGGGEQVEENGR